MNEHSYGQVSREMICEMREDIKELRKTANRLPLWATVFIAILLGIIGYLIALL